MRQYNIKRYKKDYNFLENDYNLKGSREKRLAITTNGKKALFKYERTNCSEAVSEKLCYELAKILGYECAEIELAKDKNGKIGILSYLFVDINKDEQSDAISYINSDETTRKKYYKISNIKKELDKLDEKLFFDFLKILIFDTLVGEQDRHEENWGIIKNGKYKLSPLYDNSDNLLREFKEEIYAKQYYNNKKDFNAYILRSRTWIYKENEEKRFKHFELLNYLNKLFPEIIQKELKNLEKLNDKTIEEIVEKIPSELLTNKHKEFIIIYLKKRKKIMLDLIER